ncbi:unnamed protein product [Lactuca virosa]|uniref:Uncharacterized protein n=1 Tax=Lactuca virosa TaxID=75947 RepID=A0AAU9MHK8_9ASTR|nr:unnamed protein product [Lactuca virosa]
MFPQIQTHIHNSGLWIHLICSLLEFIMNFQSGPIQTINCTESSGRIETFPLIEFINKLSMDEMHSCINRPRSFHYVFLEDQLEMIPFPRRKITSSEDFHGLSFMDVLFNNLSCASPKILAKDYNWKASLHSGKENKQQQWIFW